MDNPGSKLNPKTLGWLEPRNRSWTRPMVRLIACLPRSNDAAGRGLQGGATKAGA